MKLSLRYAAGSIAAWVLLIVAPDALAADPFTDINNQMHTASVAVADQLVPYAFRLVGLLFLIQFALRNYKAAFHVDDAKQLLAKLVFPIIWVGFLMYLINNNDTVLNAIFSSFQKLAGIAAGNIDLSPGKIMSVGIKLQNNLVATYNQATGANGGFFAAIEYFFPSMMMMFACLAIMISFFIIALAVAIATLEFYMILAAAPIAYAMGGLDALKQSSIAPLQTMLSIGYRIVILGVIVGVLRGQVAGWDASFSAVKANDWTPIWVVVFGSMLGAVAAFSAGKIAGALASGQSNISGNEAMFAGLQMMQTVATTMTAAGAMAQLAQGAAGAATGAAGTAGQGFKKLSDFMGGGAGSIANAGGGLGGGSSGGGGISPRDTAQSLLGPIQGSPWTGSSDDSPAGGFSGGSENSAASSDSGAGGSSSSPTTAGGNAADAGIGGPNEAAARGSATSARNSSTAKTVSANDMAKILDNASKATQGQTPSKTAQLGRDSMETLRGLQHDSGHVHVNVDVHSRD